jgi:choline/carnitine/betaine transport
MKGKNKINKLVFWPPFLLLISVVALNFINQDAFMGFIWTSYNWITNWFDWLYLAVGLVVVLLLMGLLFSPLGKIKFGGHDAKPKYTTLQWFSMALCGGIAIGIVFWGAAEPMYHLMNPAMGIEPMSGEAVLFSMSRVFLHWTITPYALYVIATIPIALAAYNYKQRMAISSGLYFLVGEEKVNGTFGKIVDAVCLFAVVGGISGSMGQGIMQITSGLGYVTPIEPSKMVWLGVVIFTVAAFTISSGVGMDKGLNFLSNQNVKLYAIVLVYITIVGPTAYIFKLGTQSFGTYISEFFTMHTYLGVDSGEDWSRWWTVFYWAGWMAYAPVVGVFLTRLCYGRTVRQFLVMNLLAPAAFGMLWFSVFGATVIDMQLSGSFDMWNVLSTQGLETAVFAFFSQFPFGTGLIWLFLTIIIISFITMADSMTSSIAILSTSGFHAEDGEPPLFLKIVWGTVMGMLAWVMISFAGIDGTKMVAILASLPILFLMIAFVFSTIKGLNMVSKQDASELVAITSEIEEEAVAAE